jgi:hypothetical protein
MDAKDERADGIESLSVWRLKLAAAIADALDAEGSVRRTMPSTATARRLGRPESGV